MGRGSLRRSVVGLLDRAVVGAVNAAVMVVDGARGQMGNAPKDVVLAHGKLQVARLRPRREEQFALGTDTHRVSRGRFPVPVLLIPPLMVRPYVYDLRPDHSLARTLRDRGFDVFVLDFGVPEPGDERLRLDDYVLDFVPRAVEATLRASGQGALSLAGYCMGGLFSLIHVATHDDRRVRNLVTIGAPVDFSRMGLISHAVRVGSPFLDGVLDRVGNVPAFAAIQGFKLMSGPRAITKWADLAVRLYDDEYVRAFDAVNTWVNDLIPYPRDAFKQMVREVMAENALREGKLRFGGKRADLGRVRAPLLAFAGATDNIATPAATREILHVVASEDKRLYEVPGGHVGVVAGTAAPDKVWRPMADWLATRSI
jgi:polyhydroxyalkanoate synthase